MVQCAQDPPVRSPQRLCLFDRPPKPLEVGLDLSPLARDALVERKHPAAHRRAPHRHQNEFDDHDQPGCHEQPDANRPEHRQVDLGHSLASPSSSAPTGAIATTWSSGASRITITPCVCRPMREMAPTWVRSTMPLALMISTSSSASLTTRMAASLPTRSVTLSVNTPWPARWCMGYSSTGVRFP